jgi:GNAT superfamily N-acetyltransferase
MNGKSLFLSLPNRSTLIKHCEYRLYATFPSPTLYLDFIVVSNTHQRRGIGKLLMTWGIDYARERNVDIWTEASPMGLGLYTGLGFEERGTFAVSVEGENVGVRMPILVLYTGKRG